MNDEIHNEGWMPMALEKFKRKQPFQFQFDERFDRTKAEQLCKQFGYFLEINDQTKTASFIPPLSK